MPEPIEANSAMTYSDWAASYNQSNNIGGKGANPYGVFNRIGNWFTGSADKYRENYETYLQNLNRQWEADQINNARAWEEYMDSTKYQRMVADLKAAGINPALVLSSGIGAAGQPDSPSGSVSAKYKSKEEKKAGNGAAYISSAAMVLLAIAKIAALK